MEIAEALVRLRAAADDGRLSDLCRRLDVVLLTVFGSAVRRADAAHDLDVAALFGHRDPSALLRLLEELVVLCGTERVDLMVLDHADPVARFNGLVGALPLYEDRAGRWATTQMAASGEVFDTEWLRRAELERMAGS